MLPYNLTEKFEHLLMLEVLQALKEGGWTSVKTQKTKLTPSVLKSADLFIRELIIKYNQWLENNIGVPGIKPIRPVGSGTYYEKDLEEQPDKIYGDIDYLLEYPVINQKGNRKKDETESVKFYNRKLFEFFNEEKPKGIDIEESKGSDGSTVVLIAEIEPDKFVQIDFVATFKEYTNWALARFTPIRDVKGFVTGGLYSSLAEALLLSIGEKGVRAKFQSGVLVPYKIRKNVEEETVTLNFDTLFRDILNFFVNLKNKEKAQRTSKFQTGVDVNQLSIANICNGIITLADALEANGIFDEDLLQYRNSSEFLNAVVKIFSGKMDKILNNPKFKKADSPMAIEARDKIFKMASDAKEKVAKCLKAR